VLRHHQGPHVGQEDVRDQLGRPPVPAVQDGGDGHQDRHFQAHREGSCEAIGREAPRIAGHVRHGEAARHGQLLRGVRPHAADARRVRLPDGLPGAAVRPGRAGQPDTGGHQRDHAPPGGQELPEDVIEMELAGRSLPIPGLYKLLKVKF